MHHTVQLPRESSRILAALVAGGRIRARRTYPNRFHFYLWRVPVGDERLGKEYSAELSPKLVSDLIERRLIEPIGAVTPFTDRIRYRCTPQGITAAARGGKVSEEGWPDLFTPPAPAEP